MVIFGKNRNGTDTKISDNAISQFMANIFKINHVAKTVHVSLFKKETRNDAS